MAMTDGFIACFGNTPRLPPCAALCLSELYCFAIAVKFCAVTFRSIKVAKSRTESLCRGVAFSGYANRMCRTANRP